MGGRNLSIYYRGVNDMGNLLAYSGLCTKIKAMSSKLLSESDFIEIASLSSVTEVVSFLKKHPAYQKEFQAADEASLHRAEIEMRLHGSEYSDFAKIYLFANIKQRKFMDFYFSRYEISLLKTCLRMVFDKHYIEINISELQKFFAKHSSLDLIKLNPSTTVEEFIANLEGSVYYEILSKIGREGKTTLFDYETALDLFYFTSFWKNLNQLYSKKQANILCQTYGSKIDMLNILWVYRSKKYYKMTSADIYALIIPIHYKIKKETLRAMIESETLEELSQILKGTCYVKQFQGMHVSKMEDTYHILLNKFFQDSFRQNPYSIACINTYLYEKEREIQKLTTALEGIRYGLPSDEILSYII